MLPDEAIYPQGSRTEGHWHRDCGSQQRLWLPKERPGEATAALHPYCIHCGTIKDLAVPRAKPLGYYLRGIAHLKDHLEHSAHHFKLAQVQSHLISERLGARGEFEDPYGTPGEAQILAYVEVVRSVRPDLDEELITRVLPGPRRRRNTASKENGGYGLAMHPGH